MECENCGNELTDRFIEVDGKHFCLTKERKAELDKDKTVYLQEQPGDSRLVNFVSTRQ